jgi:hypothetical protein
MKLIELAKILDKKQNGRILSSISYFLYPKIYYFRGMFLAVNFVSLRESKLGIGNYSQ